MTKRKTTKDAVKVLHSRYIKGKPKRLESLKKEHEALDIASQIYTIRKKQGLSQRQLANLVGTTQSVISRLEDAAYNGHSLQMLNRIAGVLHYKVEVHLIPDKATCAYG